MANLSDIIDGLKILHSIVSEYDLKDEFWADHDVIGVAGVSKEGPMEEERKLLDMWGWFWSEEFECWSKFV